MVCASATFSELMSMVLEAVVAIGADFVSKTSAFAVSLFFACERVQLLSDKKEIRVTNEVATIKCCKKNFFIVNWMSFFKAVKKC